MRRAVEIGLVDCAAIKTSGGKVRLRLLFTVEQLEALLIAARDDDNDMQRNETHGNAREEKTQNRTDSDGGGDAHARPPPAVATAAQSYFVIEGTPAWKAWRIYKTREKGFDWNLRTSRNVDGKSQSGWWFPSLFPPPDTQQTPS